MKYPGSKWGSADWIISHFPEHHSYLEPFFGSGGVFFNKPRSDIETINDLDGEVVNLFRQIRNDPERLAREIYFTPYSREAYEMAYQKEPENDLEKAVLFYTRLNMGHGFRTQGEKVGRKLDVQGRERAYAAADWCKIPEKIMEAAERLRGVQIENRPAVEVIRKFNFENVLIYSGIRRTTDGNNTFPLTTPKVCYITGFRGCYCVAGIDLSRTTDLTAASLIIEKDGKNYVITKFFMPRERFKVAINEENVPYNIFEQQGFLKISGEHQVDYKDVFNWFIELVKVYKIKPLKVGYDRYCAGYLVQEMKEAGFHMDDVYQGTNLTPVLHTFEGDLKDGAYCLGENNLLRAHLLNVAVDININDSRMKPVKLEKRAHIDGAVSVFDALAVKMKFHKEIGRQLTNAA